MDFVKGFAIFKFDKILRGSLLFTIFGWILIDLFLFFWDESISLILINITIAVFHGMLVLIILSTFTDVQKWSFKKIFLILLASLPLYLVTFYLFMNGIGIILIAIDLIVSAIFAHWFSINIGAAIQEKTTNSPLLGIIIYLFSVILAIILYLVLIQKLPLAEGYGNVAGSLFINVIILAWISIIGLIIGLIWKSVPVSLGPYFLVSILYFIYLFYRLQQTVAGTSQQQLTLISIPVNIFFLIYGLGIFSNKFFILQKVDIPTRKVRTSMLIFMLSQISVHITLLFSIFSGDSDTGSVPMDNFFAFFRLMLYIGLLAIMGIIIVIKFSRKPKPIQN